MTTRGRRSNSSACRSRDRADALERAAVGDRRGGRSRRPGPGRSGTARRRQEVVQRRDRVRAHRVGRAAERLDELDDAERRPERVGIGVLVADGQHPPRAAEALDDDVRHGVEVRRQVDGHRRACRWAGPARRVGRRRRRVAWAGSTADGGSSAGRPRGARAATGVGSVSPSGRSPSGAVPALELVEQLQDARAPLGRVVELDVQVRDALDAAASGPARAGRTASPARAPRWSASAPSAGR